MQRRTHSFPSHPNLIRSIRMIIRREDVENNIPVFPDNGIVPVSDSDERPRHPMGKDPEDPTLSFIDTDHVVIKYQICDTEDDFIRNPSLPGIKLEICSRSISDFTQNYF